MTTLISNQPTGPDDQLAEVTTYQGSMSLRIYAMGFLEVARVAARAALEHRTAIDAITPSIIYAIRHAAELFLKAIIIEVTETHPAIAIGPNSKMVVAEPKLAIHSLQHLWNEHRGSVADMLDGEARNGGHPSFDRHAWLADFDKIIDEIHKVDPDGQALRYPMDKRGSPNLGSIVIVSVGCLERFALHATECFSGFSARDC